MKQKFNAFIIMLLVLACMPISAFAEILQGIPDINVIENQTKLGFLKSSLPNKYELIKDSLKGNENYGNKLDIKEQAIPSALGSSNSNDKEIDNKLSKLRKNLNKSGSLYLRWEPKNNGYIIDGEGTINDPIPKPNPEPGSTIIFHKVLNNFKDNLEEKIYELAPDDQALMDRYKERFGFIEDGREFIPNLIISYSKVKLPD